MARFIKDWIGFPAAVIAAIAALAGPAAVNILWLIGQDGAHLTFRMLRPDFINVGLDDTPIPSHDERVDVTIPFWRAALVNNGASPAAVRPEFVCSLKDEKNRIFGGQFYFFDLTTQRKLLNDVEIAAGGTSFVNVALSDAGPIEHGYPAPKEPDTCQFIYSDKYGERPPLIIAQQNGARLMTLNRADDRRVSDREAYCSEMAKGIRLGGEPVDCVSATHLLAIETVTLWERALGRAMRQTGEFRRANPGSDRTAGIILESCEDENCKAEEERLATALREFSPSVSVWLCPERPIGSRETVVMTQCARTDYPLAR